MSPGRLSSALLTAIWAEILDYDSALSDYLASPVPVPDRAVIVAGSGKETFETRRMAHDQTALPGDLPALRRAVEPQRAMTASLVIIFGAGGRLGMRLLPLLTGHPATVVVGLTRQHTVSGHSGDPRWIGVDVTDPDNWPSSLDTLTNLAVTHQRVILVDLLLDRTSVTAMRTSLAAVTSYILRLRDQLTSAGKGASLVTASTTATLAPWPYQTPYGLAKRHQLARYINSGMAGSAFLLPSLTETSTDEPLHRLTWTYAQAAHDVATRVIHASSPARDDPGPTAGGASVADTLRDGPTIRPRTTSHIGQTSAAHASSTPVRTVEFTAVFYRDQHDLISQATHTAQQRHTAAHADRHAELATVETRISETNNALDRYLSTFERGTLDEDTVGDRLRELHTKSKQLRTRRDELTLDDEPTTPDPATLDEVAQHINDVITTGTHNQQKGLVEALIATSPSPDPTSSSRSSASPNPTTTTGTQPSNQRKRPQKEWFAQ